MTNPVQAQPTDQDRAELIRADDDQGLWLACGSWTLDHLAALTRPGPRSSPTARLLDARSLSRLDSAGALKLLETARVLGLNAEDIRIEDRYRRLLEAVAGAVPKPSQDGASGPATWRVFVEHVGEATVTVAGSLIQLVGFLGLTLATLARVLVRPGRLRLTSLVHHMEQSGLNALPLIALLSFLIGAVVAFLGATVLRDFGAELFVVDLTGYAFLREFGVLLAAILVAGRTASAYAAQIGTMKSREEIDAIRTLGLDAVALLVIPRLLALVIMLPLLTVLAMLSGLAGGMVVAVFSLDIGADLYINRLYETIELRHYLVGLSKAPIFAAVIALVGCLEGFKVAGTAQSVGERTTSAVVQSISLVIVIDALAAVFFMQIGW